MGPISLSSFSNCSFVVQRPRYLPGCFPTTDVILSLAVWSSYCFFLSYSQYVMFCQNVSFFLIASYGKGSCFFKESSFYVFFDFAIYRADLILDLVVSFLICSLHILSFHYSEFKQFPSRHKGSDSLCSHSASVSPIPYLRHFLFRIQMWLCWTLGATFHPHKGRT